MDTLNYKIYMKDYIKQLKDSKADIVNKLNEMDEYIKDCEKSFKALNNSIKAGLISDKEFLQREYNKEYYHRVRKYNIQYKEYQREQQILIRKNKRVGKPPNFKSKVKESLKITFDFDNLIIEI